MDHHQLKGHLNLSPSCPFVEHYLHHLHRLIAEGVAITTNDVLRFELGHIETCETCGPFDQAAKSAFALTHWGIVWDVPRCERKWNRGE